MNTEEQNKLEQYFQACILGDIETIKKDTEKLKIIYNYSYFRHAVMKATDTNQFNIIKYLFNKFDEVAKYSELQESQDPNYNNPFRYSTYNFNFENYGISILETCKNGYLDILKFFIDRLGGIGNINNYEKCARSACENGHLDVVKYLLSIPDAENFINYKKYYNCLFTSHNFKGNHVIKYFLDDEQLNKHVKQLALLTDAYYKKNKEIVEYLVIDKNMLYSKKIKKAVEGLNSVECNIPQLFEKREIIKLAEQLNTELNNKSDSKKRLKL